MSTHSLFNIRIATANRMRLTTIWSPNKSSQYISLHLITKKYRAKCNTKTKQLLRSELIWHRLENRYCQNNGYAIKSKKLSVEHSDQIMARHKSGKGYKPICTAYPETTVASIVLQWKELGKSWTFLTLAVWPNWQSRQKGPLGQITIFAVLHILGLYGSSSHC